MRGRDIGAALELWLRLEYSVWVTLRVGFGHTVSKHAEHTRVPPLDARFGPHLPHTLL